MGGNPAWPAWGEPRQHGRGEVESIGNYRGKVLLIVNTASKCGLTPQYKGLQELYDRFREQGFEVLGFPCNQFGLQEPGEGGEIAEFCEINYGVTFPMFAKIKVNGRETHPLFDHLKKQAPGALGTEAVKWNFTKFLVSREGVVLRRYSPQTTPQELASDVAQSLEETSPS